jgi:ferredoxin
MGSILTPLLTSLEESNALPNACTSCGRCAEICPADIPLPDLLRDLRHDETKQKLSPVRWRLGMRAHAWLARHPIFYRAVTGIGIFTLHFLGRGKGSFSKLPLASGWTSQRDFPAPQGKTFMQQLAAIQREDRARKHKETRLEEKKPTSGKPQKNGTGRNSERREPVLREDWARKPDPKEPATVGTPKTKAAPAVRKKTKAQPGGPRGNKPGQGQADD